MAVKVMVAPAIARGELARTGPSQPREAPAPKATRRRSSVYDANGNEVFITLICLKCHKTRPLSAFGLRKMADGAIRNQPWCRTCRSASGAEAPRRSKGPAETGESPVAVVSPAEENVPRPAGAPRSLSAEIAAALAAGSRR